MNMQSLEELTTPTPIHTPIPTVKDKSKTILIGYLYFIQGIMLSLPSTIYLTYSNLPSYDVLSWFAASSLPFGLKFISAPVVQKYTSLRYGRRKTWIVISCFLTSLCTWILSYYTDQQYMLFMAVSFIFVIFLISIEDISTDALGIKQLNSPQLLSYLQSLMQQVGLVFGSMVFIKMTSKDFAQSWGFQNSFMSPTSYFKMVSLIILIPTIFIHFKFKQTLIQQQKQMKQKSLWQILLNYKHFINIKSRYFRQAIAFLIFYQGINFFASGYSFQLIKQGFSKQTMNTVDNIIMIPLLILTGLFSSLNTNSKRLFYIRTLFIARLIWQIVGFYFNDHSSITFALYSFISSGLSSMVFIVDCNSVNGIPSSALSGMFLTALYSFRNLGNNSQSLHLKIISFIGFGPAVAIGTVYTFILILLLPKIIRWIDQGTFDLNKQRNNGDQVKPLKQG